ncbi:MAG: Bax inhibitor-1/YccA family protein [Planctomycetota bacterium]|nr:Bax inhibitor-1/YccA family protein [Planctomycetota bacterium]
MNLTSTNPVLADASLSNVLRAHRNEAMQGVATVQGIVNKTTGCVILATLTGVGGYALATEFPAMSWVIMIVASIASLIVFFTLARTPERCAIGAPMYASIQGVALGAITWVFESILAAQGGSVMGGLALQAFVITIALMLAMLGAYRMGLIRPTARFKAFMSVATIGIALVYLVSFILSMFSIHMPFISMGSALEGGTPALIGIGLNVLILGIAALWFVIDFGKIEEAVNSGAPSSMEWFLTFGLIVSLAWVYLEALKLAFRLALMGRRN